MQSSTLADSQRFGAIDAVRGTAMLFVFLSHFTAGYLWQAGATGLASNLTAISMIASPTFVLVSGLVVGFMAATEEKRFLSLRIKLIDRGLFVLVIGHIVLAFTQTPSLPDFPRTLRSSFITDAIGVSVIIGPWLITSLSARLRSALAVSLYVLSWVAVFNWQPVSANLIAFKQYGFGLPLTQSKLLVFPIVPWFAVYIIGTVLGQAVGKFYSLYDRLAAHIFLARVGLALLLAGATAHLGMKLSGLRADISDVAFLSIYQKFPPAPAFLAFFGGLGLLLLVMIFEIERRQLAMKALEPLRTLGRASMFAFIAQYAFYGAFLRRLHIPYSKLWPVLFASSVVVLIEAARFWDRHNGNRYLTVGIASLLRQGRSVTADSLRGKPKVIELTKKPVRLSSKAG